MSQGNTFFEGLYCLSVKNFAFDLMFFQFRLFSFCTENFIELFCLWQSLILMKISGCEVTAGYLMIVIKLKTNDI